MKYYHFLISPECFSYLDTKQRECLKQVEILKYTPDKDGWLSIKVDESGRERIRSEIPLMIIGKTGKLYEMRLISEAQ